MYRYSSSNEITERKGILDVWRKGLDPLKYTPGEFEEMQAQHNPFIEHALEEGTWLAMGWPLVAETSEGIIELGRSSDRLSPVD